jgi:HEPN domain-containing protein
LDKKYRKNEKAFYALQNIVAFHCQQAIEKYFKAYILEHDKIFAIKYDGNIK